ncbi:LytR family transcriptional attenuator [Curtobacterium sp. PhB130]|uniref:LCP family protein n=1 Tax=unclassified Curtobacterium TaxID=257496 RepID=UPI000F4BB915|nr:MULTISPECIES: LCP family protein [unclassified Curtobacterium]ROP61030.1 LytR family transcriptional attenuator [Curtobacterium sp. ZW137]ROS75859.1 LytR family transcriptional attenuator [Curtobacterium sp. PhB130]TCK64407.1 LytR family transcriptional attenuator [Curtobacterium sp. PhB136]
MNDVRDRSHRLNRATGIARHGRLHRHRPFGTIAKVLSGVVAVALVSSFSVAAIAAKQVSDDLGDGVAIQGQPVTKAKSGGTALSAYKGGFNILVVGTDNDPAQGTEYGKRDATLNDVNILLHVSADHTNATAVSIPRDLVTPIPACQKTDGSGTTSAMAAQPINTAWGDGGLNCVVQTVQGLTGLDIQYSAAVSFNGVIEMSNAIGGVPVCVASPIHDQYTGLDLPAGTTTLQGSQALEFLRTRHGVGDGSDLGRISSQQVFLSSLLRTVKSNSTLTSPTTLYKLARAAASNMQLSQSLNDIGTMVQMGRALQDLPLAQVNFVQYPGSTGGTGVYAGKVEPTTYLADELFAKIKSDQSFSLGADSTGIGSETAPSASASPSSAASAPAAPASAPAAASSQAAAPSTSAPSAPATSSTIDGLQGQSADEQTCSKAFGS